MPLADDVYLRDIVEALTGHNAPIDSREHALSIIDQAIRSASSAAGRIQYQRVKIEHAQIKELALTPAVLIPAPGAGKMLVFHNAILRNGITVPYTGLGANNSVSIISLVYGADSDTATVSQLSSVFDNEPATADGDLASYNLVQGLLAGGGGEVYPLTPLAYVSKGGYVNTFYFGSQDNLPISVWMNTLNDVPAELGAGDAANFLQFDIWYSIVAAP